MMSQSDRDSEAAANRVAFPELARAVDEWRAAAGPGVRLLHGIEGGRVLGRLPVYEDAPEWWSGGA